MDVAAENRVSPCGIKLRHNEVVSQPKISQEEIALQYLTWDNKPVSLKNVPVGKHINMVFSIDGSILAIFRDSNLYDIWDTRTGNMLGFRCSDRISTLEITAIAFLQNKLVTGRMSGKVDVWEVYPRFEFLFEAPGVEVQREGLGFKLVQSFKAHQDKVDCISFSPNGESMMTHGYNGSMCIWNTNGYGQIKRPKGYTIFSHVQHFHRMDPKLSALKKLITGVIC